MRINLTIITILLTIFLSPVLSFCETVTDNLQSAKINKKIWKVGKLGKVTANGRFVELQSGDGEEYASLTLKKKVNPDDEYRFTAKIFPLKANGSGFSVEICGPGWNICCGANGAFWLNMGRDVVGSTSANPMSHWYNLSVENKRNLLGITITDAETNKVIIKWIVPQTGGLSGNLEFRAVTGTNRTGYRSMRVKDMNLEIVEKQPETTDVPANHSECCADTKNWVVKGTDAIKEVLDGPDNAQKMLHVKLMNGGSVMYKFDQPISLDKIYSIDLTMKIQTADESFTIQYAFVSENGGIFYFNELNVKNGWDWTNRTFYPGMAASYGNPDKEKIIGFSVSFAFVDKPLDLWFKEIYLKTFKP